MKALILFCALAVITSTAPAAPEVSTAEDTSKTIDPRLNEREDWSLNEQAKALLEQVDSTLIADPPENLTSHERRLALLLLDGILHEVYAPHRPPVQQFFHQRIEKAAEEMESTVVETGARIWKLYNHGFVIRTHTVTFGFDLVRPGWLQEEGFGIPDSLMQRLVDQCDVLFISHLHGDHADPWVVDAFLRQGKPVVAPPEVWSDEPERHQQITHLDRVAHMRQKLSVQNGRHTLDVVIYPGHQGPDAENNVTLVFTPEGMSFCQMGDQWVEEGNEEDWDWIDQVAAHHRVDVLLPNCWVTDIVRVVHGFNPKLVITGHENEMGHTIDHREPYWLTYQRKQGSERFEGNPEVGYEHPLAVMTWGESILYRPLQ